MNEQEIYELLVWSVKAAGAVIVLVISGIAAMRYVPSFPEDDGESM